MLQQTHTISNKGLQSFAEASPDYEFAPVGLGSMHEQAKKLAEYGRNGDIYVVHAAEGETVIPLEVLNANPKIKELLFGQMRGMGLDPQEFVVGSELNSINPDTGLPEFFFKSVFRGVKKAVKSVAKIAKKAAPVVIPMAAAYFGFGPLLGPAFGPGTFGASFIGGGIGSLAGGASLKDSFKAGLISGGLASLTGGLKSKFTGGDFGAGVSRSFTGAGAPSFDLQAERFGSMFSGDNAENFLLAKPDQSSLASMGVDSTDDLLSNLGITAPSISAGGGTFSGGSGDGLIGGSANDMLGSTSLTKSADIPGYSEQTGRLLNDPLYDSIKNQGLVPTQDFLNNRSFYGDQFMPIEGDLSIDPTLTKSLLGNSGYNTGLAGHSIVNPGGSVIKPTLPNAPSGYDQFFAGTKLLDTGMSAPDPLPETTILQDIFGTKNADAISKFGDQVTDKLQPVTDFMFPPMPTDSALDLKTKELMTQYPSTYMGITGADRAAAEAARILTPSLLEQYGPTAALALGGAKLGGAFDTPEVENVTRADLPGFEGPTGYELFQADPSAFKIANINPYRYDTGNPLVASAYAADGGYIEKPQDMNRGGTPQFPRREMLIEGPGTETSDDIPAMLSDGEFVMNAKAVRGADPSGNGNRQAGAKSLYDMMRNFEMRA